MFIGDREIQLMMGDLTGFWNDYRMYYLMPTFYYSLQTAIIATIFLRNESEVCTNQQRNFIQISDIFKFL